MSCQPQFAPAAVQIKLLRGSPHSVLILFP